MDVVDEIKAIVAAHPIVLFMKGTPEVPTCGFSDRAVKALEAAGAAFFSVNIVADPRIRAGLPHYSNWPTFPQLFLLGEFIGGCDIVEDLHAAGELKRMAADVAGGRVVSAWSSVGLPDGWRVAPGELAGRVVIVTGSTGGLGSETAKAAVRAGATVVITGRKVRALEKLYDELVALGGAEPVIHPLDLESATPADYAALAEGIEKEFGRLDGIVHAAAHFNELTPIAMHKPDDWLRAMQVNVSAPFALTQACMPLLTRADDSAVVFVFDDPELVSRAHWGGYGVSKAAVERMAAVLHAENGRGSMRVHALLPAPMRTALRRAAYYGENTLERPLPTASAEAIVYLLSGAGADARGAVLDIRHTH